MDIIDHLQDEEEFLLNLKIESRRVKPVIPSATLGQLMLASFISTPLFFLNRPSFEGSSLGPS